MIRLRGTTWNHIRGFAPLHATARQYQSVHPAVEIQWEIRSLQDFADFPIESLAERYDLINLDHPSVGTCEAAGCLLPLDPIVPSEELRILGEHSVGRSHISYLYNNRHWALAIDAASHVSVYRADLLQRSQVVVPRTWDEVVSVALRLKRDGRCLMAIPLIPVDSLMCFYSLCAASGEDPLSVGDQGVVSRECGRRALSLMQQLLNVSHPNCLSWNPIQVLDCMSHTDEVAYCPWLFGYSNYSRPGFAPHRCTFANVPVLTAGPSRGAILGGTGLAISSKCAHPEVAADYARYVASAECQKGIYFESGGQPGNIEAWRDPDVNQASGNFFQDTLETLTHAYLRPRYSGYIEFQTEAGLLIHQFLKDGGETDAVLEGLNRLLVQNQLHR